MRRPLAYAKKLVEHRRSGGRVGLLVVSLHDWKSGLWFEASPEVFRVLLPNDLSVADADWSVCLALDVVVCGSADDAIFNAAVREIVAGGAVSVWGEFAQGISRIEVLCRGTVVTVDDPVPVNKLGAALRAFRPRALALGIGGYDSRVFDAARMALFGPLIAELQASLEEGC